MSVLGLVALHGSSGGGFALSWPALLVAIAFWGTVGGGLYWYYTNQLAAD